MSNHEFGGFDVDAITDVVRQPSLDDLMSVAQSRRRRRAGGMTLALVVVFAAMAVVPLTAGRGQDGWTRPAPPPPARARGGEVFLTGPDSGVAVHNSTCAIRFAHTRDGGVSWTDYDAARYQATSCRADGYGGEEADLEFAVLSDRSYLIRDGVLLRLSTDYGRSWREAAQAMVAVTAFPTQARAVFSQDSGSVIQQPLAVDPTTGTVYQLSGEPPSPSRPRSIYPTADGAIWVTYWPGGLDVMLVARSVDRGATWTTWQPAKGADVRAVVGIDKQEAYLLVDPPAPPGTPPTAVAGPVQLLRTTDGGRSWADVGTDLPDTQEMLRITVGADGALLVAESDTFTPESTPPPTFTSRLWTSQDEGRHFTNVQAYRRNDGGIGASPGLAWLYGRDDMTVSGADHVLFTSDGRTWTRFPLPD
ncbi:WD40/YVTN/BNR-like repeat-containing protein [Micromonospora sp. NBC_00617]|uniref:WD40/YVTN/BNR-like repeat-containing protein n=1 Tax=Micromonospora sp. NBC_00617 TaxID=2903587 RepID=UPI0030E5EC17